MMMTRFVQLLVLSVVATHTADACKAADVGKAVMDKCSGTEAQEKALACAKDAGTDVCAALKCSMDAAECTMGIYDDMGCCDDAGMKAAMEAADKAFQSQMKQGAYKDCKDIKYPPCGGGGGDGDAGGATSTTMSAFALLAVMVAKMF